MPEVAMAVVAMMRDVMSVPEVVMLGSAMRALEAAAMVEIPGLRGGYRKAQCGEHCNYEQVFGEHLNLLG